MRNFRKTIRDCGYSIDDFELSEITRKAIKDDIEDDRHIVVVRRKRTGVKRYYEDRQGTNWLRKFESNLRGNVFGFSGLISARPERLSRPYLQH
jgi:hypothetical protein